MTLRLDSEFSGILNTIRTNILSAEQLDVQDVDSRRRATQLRFSCLPPSSLHSTNVCVNDYTVQVSDGEAMKVYEFCHSDVHASKAPSAGILYIHGGGMTMGSALDTKDMLAWYASEARARIFSVEYRLAPEFPHPIPVEDCYSALVWLYHTAEELNVDTKRIAVIGESAGGGLAAGVSLLVRDRGILHPPLAKQILIEPMLDDRNTTSAEQSFATWTYDDNLAGWTALLGDRVGKDDVSAYASPSRATDLTHLPPTYIDIGGLDIFRKEAIRYAADLLSAGAEVEFHLYPGVPHAFIFLRPEARVATRARENRLNSIRGV